MSRSWVRVGVHTHEVYFRDTAYGFLAWAFATVLSAAVLASAASNIVGGTSAGLSQAAGSAAAQSTGPSTGDVAAPRDELYRLFTSSLSSGGDFAPADRTYMAQVVAARTGLNQADAEKRVSHVIALAKSAADNARKTAAQFALWLTASLLFGAFHG